MLALGSGWGGSSANGRPLQVTGRPKNSPTDLTPGVRVPLQVPSFSWLPLSWGAVVLAWGVGAGDGGTVLEGSVAVT